MLHFKLRFGDDPNLQTPQIRTQDFYYYGPRCVIKPQEIAVCVPCVVDNHQHTKADPAVCELSTFSGWKTPDNLESIAAFVLDNLSTKYLVLESGESLYRFLTVGSVLNAPFTKCRICPTSFFDFKNVQHGYNNNNNNNNNNADYDDDDDDNDDDRMDYDDDDDDEYNNDSDSGISGDVNNHMVYIALENIENVTDLY
jgi:hypothetical protein